MKKVLLSIGIAGLAFVACNNTTSDRGEVNALREEAIAIHDEIMPQVSLFDRTTVKIDSILSHLGPISAERPTLDTSHARIELTALKTNLTNATDGMMAWMHDFDPNMDTGDEEAKKYYEGEVRKMEELKRQFDEAAKQTADKLAPFE